MEVETILRELASIVHRAWYKCQAKSPNSELLMALSAALTETALEHQRSREQEEAIDRETANAKLRNAADEKEIRERMPAAQ